MENAIGALVEGALSTLKGLGRILGPFRALMTRLRNFLGKVLGRATRLEAAALRAAESTAPKLGSRAVPRLPGPGKAGTPHAKPSAAPKRGRSRPGGGAVNDNDVPLRKGETVKEPSPKAADPTDCAPMRGRGGRAPRRGKDYSPEGRTRSITSSPWNSRTRYPGDIPTTSEIWC
ncbi:hypothetical protein [Streptomyces sp. MJM1172]|uniref:hypothetical protein n=1 Tax=Streptomyces sp. MJM1172 TaxID=1703926 RepID=UPI00093EC8BC|nr:hypothetical protein [Streptomyces sp. MJM1172]OKI50836.1 hypothetical protein AMK15_31820 [Streptomyces sp. MJM1172]